MLTYGSTRQPFHVLPAAAEIEGHGRGWSMTSRQLPLQSLSEGPARGASLPLCWTHYMREQVSVVPDFRLQLSRGLSVFSFLSDELTVLYMKHKTLHLEGFCL